MTVKPISPDDAVLLKAKIIPDVVIETVNEAIAKNYNGGYAAVFQHEIITMLKAKNISSEEVFRNKWLDIEDIYREAGWIVNYDRPGYNESYEASFTFRKQK